ncbi:pyruvate dehydrogenase (acetyl-transferring) E1 component subunit alpha [Georgenia yuyongxinii]|nr:pyruvate dehydrogenase (acetyl-transferring) E1 component subunit alpha [Georgenia yuyongxinii]
MTTSQQLDLSRTEGSPWRAPDEHMEPVQLLTPDGDRVTHPDFEFDLDDEAIKTFYRQLTITRRVDFEATAMQRHGELGIWVPLTGQEAAQIGSAAALEKRDFVFPTYREHGLAWLRGVDLLKVLSLYRGADQGSWDPEEHNFALYPVVIGSQVLHAVGYGMGMRYAGESGTGDLDQDRAVLAFFGDGATSQGDVNEGFVFAASYQAPVVFFCQNNQWAISEPTERQARVPLYRRADGFGFPGVRVDGNDVLACYAVVRSALQHARSGLGPVFIESYTYRMGAHTTTDDPTRYRDEAEVEPWKRKDPILRVKAYLTKNKLVDDDFFAEIEAECDAIGEHLREGCKLLPDPLPRDVFDWVYADGSPELVAQRRDYDRYVDTLDQPEGGRA